MLYRPAVIDLDHNATTPLDSRVRAAMIELLGDPACEGNPSSVHRRGQRARGVVELARRQVAAAVGAEPLEVTFCSGGTEADALAVLGACRGLRASNRPCGLLTSPIEHPAVLGPADQLRAEGVPVVLVPVDERGRVLVEAVVETLARHPEVGVVSIQAANHELGTLQPIAELSSAVRERRPEVLIHCDAVQAFGKLGVDFQGWGVDLLSVSSHKIHGPKGAGALVHRKTLSLAPLWTGGAQERGRRAGTESVLALHGFGVAAELAHEEWAERQAGFAPLRARLVALLESIPGVTIEGEQPGIGNTVMATFAGCSGELLLMNLDLAGITVSTGAACNAGTLGPSKVLLALGQDRERAASALRFSLGKDSRLDELDRLAAVLPDVVERVRAHAGPDAGPGRADASRWG